MNNENNDNNEYYKLFYSIITGGICNGVYMPFEAWVAYYRFCCEYASSIHEDGGRDMIYKLFKYSRRFFNDIYNNTMLAVIPSDEINENVIEWIKNLYKNSNNIFKDEITGWMITAYKYNGELEH